MPAFILVYVTCKDPEEARKVGEHLLRKRLCACINIFPEIQSVYWWPPKANKLETANESVLVFKTLEKNFPAVETEIFKIHSYARPNIFALPVSHISKEYLAWTLGEMKSVS